MEVHSEVCAVDGHRPTALAPPDECVDLGADSLRAEEEEEEDTGIDEKMHNCMEREIA